MIAVELNGRLGNQLFQYAFGLAAALRLGVRFYVITANGVDFALRRHFVLGSPFAGEVPPDSPLLANLDTMSFGNETPPSDIVSSLKDHRIYRGFFQSETCFDAAASQIRRHFRPTLRTRLKHFGAARRLGLKRRPYAAVHVRRTDYLTWQSAEFGGSGFALAPQYYRNAACLLKATGNTAQRTLLIGDDPEFAAREIAPLFPNPEVVTGNTALEDFSLLREADALVISNSSFAWWAAWLNTSAPSRVVAPRHWLGLHLKKEAPVGVIPARWLIADPA